MIFKVEHKYCGYTKMIEGENVFDAFKKSNLDFNIWTVVEAEKK